MTVTLRVHAGEDTPSSIDAGVADSSGRADRDAASPEDSPVAPSTDLSAVDCGLRLDSDAQAPAFDGAAPANGAPVTIAENPPVRPALPTPEPATTVAYGGRDVPRAGLRHFGVGIDVGVSGVLPDAGLLLTARPVRWGHLQLGAGYNGLAPGIRGGLTLINPWVVPLSLTWEAGHYFEGDANRVVHWVDSSTKSNASLQRFGYDYMNVLGGLSVGDRRFAFYLRFGVTWMRTTVHGFEQTLRETTKLDVTAADPTIRYRGPALKVGFDYFL